MSAAIHADLDSLDHAALKVLAVELQSALAAQEAELTSLETEFSELRQQLTEQSDELRSRSEQIEHLKRLVEKLRHKLFGRKSEKITAQLEQLELQLEELETEQAAAEIVADAVVQQAGPVSRPGRKPLPEHLPREVVTHECHSNCCAECGGELRKFGEDVSEQIEYIPESFKVIRHVRPKFTCSNCDRIAMAPLPGRAIERGLAGPAMLAHVLVSKFCDHLPLYRQSEIYARQGVDLGRSTLANWVGACAELLTPLLDALGRHVFSGTKLHADDTPIPVLEPGRGKTRTGRLWTYVRDDRPCGDTTPPAVWFAYSEDRKGEHPRTHLKNFKGALQADAYAGFNHLYGDGIYEAACWAHARRNLHDIHVLHASPTTTEALNRIGAFYAIEEDIRGKPVEVRREVRQSLAKPLLDDFRQWMENTLRQLSPKSQTAGAIRYALTRWRALTRYVDDGRLEIDNNTAERALRAVALGRKNYLFAGSDAGGERAAAMYSLIGSAKLNGFDPERYLRTVLARINDHPINRINELLPWVLSNELDGTAHRAA